MPVLRMVQAIKKNKISLTTLLTGLVSLSVVLTLTIMLIASYQSKKQSLYDTTLFLNHSSASKMSQTMDSLFKAMKSSLQYTTSFFSTHDPSSAVEVNEHLELIRNSSNYFNSLIIVDETGLIRAISPQSIGSAGNRITTEAAEEALAQRKPYVSKPYTSASSKRLIVFISEPLFDKEGVYRGYIGGTLYLQENNVLNMIYGSNSIDETGSYFYVVGSDGHLVYHPDKSRLGQNVSDNLFVQKLLQGKSGYELIVNSKGVTMLAGYSYVPENGWGIVVLSPISIVYDQLNNQIKAILLYTLPPFILLMLVTIWLARKLAQPFVTLTNIVSRIGKEEVNLPITKQHWNREADWLTKTVILALNGIKAQTDQLTHEAMTDALTGLNNRRTMETIMKQWTEEQTPFSIIVLDIDHFKKVNDTYGHLAGDQVLQYLAEIVKQSVGPGDICSRYGGEEFVVLLPLVDAAAAYAVTERIRITMEKGENHLKQIITISLGIAHYPTHTHVTDELFHLADQALYKAKHDGRNRTMIVESHS